MYNATQLVSGHLNDSQRDFAYCNAPQFNATICLLLFASSRSASQRDLSRRGATHLSATLLNDLFVTFRASTRRVAAPRVAAPRIAPQRNDLFVTTPLHAARLLTGHHGSPPLTAPQFNSTICLLLRVAPKRSAPQLYTPFGSAPLRNSTQRTET
jgi:hypothetical protein